MFPRLLALFIIVPLIELALFIQIGQRIGLAATIATIILTAMIGASLTRFQGLKTLQRYQEAIAAGRLPHEEVMDGIMILVAAAVLLTPGFFTDALGFLLLVPPVRAMIRLRVGKVVAGRIQVVEAEMGGRPGPEPEPETKGVSSGGHFPSDDFPSHRGEKIVDADVIRED
jgi:UPF0716 protein FxsA